MSRSDSERLAYGRGYNAGASRRWPDHKPPRPPNEVVAKLMDALQDISDAVDNMCATFPEDDPLVAQMWPLVDKSRDALASVTQWLKDQAP